MSGVVVQEPVFPEPGRTPTSVRRPDGRLYRPRKLPLAMLLSDEDEFVTGVCVLRTHSEGTARELAVEELQRHDNAFPWELTNVRTEWGHWRPDGAEGRRAWERDETGLTGTPALFFDAVQR